MRVSIHQVTMTCLFELYIFFQKKQLLFKFMLTFFWEQGLCVWTLVLYLEQFLFSKKKSYVFSKVEIDILTILNDKWIQSSNCIRSFLNQKKKKTVLGVKFQLDFFQKNHSFEVNPLIYFWVDVYHLCEINTFIKMWDQH